MAKSVSLSFRTFLCIVLIVLGLASISFGSGLAIANTERAYSTYGCQFSPHTSSSIRYFFWDLYTIFRPSVHRGAALWNSANIPRSLSHKAVINNAIPTDIYLGNHRTIARYAAQTFWSSCTNGTWARPIWIRYNEYYNNSHYHSSYHDAFWSAFWDWLAAHEFGHALGLAHHGDWVNFFPDEYPDHCLLMNPFVDQNCLFGRNADGERSEHPAIFPKEGDIQGIMELYGR